VLILSRENKISVPASNQNLVRGAGNGGRDGKGAVERPLRRSRRTSGGAEDNQGDLELEHEQRTTGAMFGSRPSYLAEHRASGGAASWGALRERLRSGTGPGRRWCGSWGSATTVGSGRRQVGRWVAAVRGAGRRQCRRVA
jgi:hypothetical protein